MFFDSLTLGFLNHPANLGLLYFISCITHHKPRCFAHFETSSQPNSHPRSAQERAALGTGDVNDVPLAVGTFFRWPTVVSLHSGFVWCLGTDPPSLYCVAKNG